MLRTFKRRFGQDFGFPDCKCTLGNMHCGDERHIYELNVNGEKVIGFVLTEKPGPSDMTLESVYRIEHRFRPVNTISLEGDPQICVESAWFVVTGATTIAEAEELMSLTNQDVSELAHELFSASSSDSSNSSSNSLDSNSDAEDANDHETTTTMTKSEASGDGSDKDPDDDVTVRASCSTRNGIFWGRRHGQGQRSRHTQAHSRGQCAKVASMALAKATDGEALGDGSDKDPDDDVSVRACCSTRTGSSWGKPGWCRKRPRSETPTGIPKKWVCAECEASIVKFLAMARRSARYHLKTGVLKTCWRCGGPLNGKYH